MKDRSPGKSSYQASDPDNLMVWDRRAAPHFEVWEASFNHTPSQHGFTIRYVICAPRGSAPYGQLTFDLNDALDPTRSFSFSREVSLDDLEHCSQPFFVGVAGCSLSSGELKGRLSGEAYQRPDPKDRQTKDRERTPIPEISWDLAFPSSDFTHRQLPEIAYKHGLGGMQLLTPNLSTQFSGTIRVGDRVFCLDQEPGSQSHRWGVRHAHSWAWGRCQGFREDPTACLDALTLRVRRGPIILPPVTVLSLYLGREVYHFRDLWLAPLTRGQWETGLYRFGATGVKIKVEGELRCRPEDLLQRQDKSPDGTDVFAHCTSVADASVRVHQRRSALSSFRQILKLSSRMNAHFEYARRRPDGRVEAQTTPIFPVR